MNIKFITLFVFAILFGCAWSAQSDIQLHVADSSDKWWMAVQPRNDGGATTKVELREGGSQQWQEAVHNVGWGYFQINSKSGVGFKTPIAFRFTSKSGQRVETTAFMTMIVGNVMADTGVQYGSSAPSTVAPTPVTQAPSPATPAPTQPATQAPRPATPAPTQPATQAPRPATPAPTPATQAPRPATPAPTPATQAPTRPPTQAPTRPPTQAPTRPPTPPPTRPPTPAPAAVDLCTVTSAKSEPVKILVPLYVYPGAAWDQLVTVQRSGVPVIAIINPMNGPLAAGPNAAYSTYIKKLRDAGVTVIGYVHTVWGDRSVNTVMNDINLYANLYSGIDGIFFDEAATGANQIPYYRQLYNHVLSKGMRHSILNPGLQPDRGYVDISTNIVIFENYATSLGSASYSSWVKCAPNAASKAGWKYKFSSIVHTANLADMPWLIATSQAKGMGLVYITDGAGGCCTYNHLANYFVQMGNAVKTLNTQGSF